MSSASILCRRLKRERGIVRRRVTLSLRSAEILPWFYDPPLIPSFGCVINPLELETCEISPSVKCRYKGEKVPTTGLLRPGRRERRPVTPLFPISMYTPLDGSTRGNRAKHESRPYTRAGKLAKLRVSPPVETCEMSEISPSVKCRYKGEKVPTTDLLRPGRRERRPATALFLISMYTPLDGSTGEKRAKHGCSLDRHAERNPRLALSLDRAVERECQARIFSRPPLREKSALGTLSRPGGRERVPGADLLSTARPREIRAWHSLSTATPREIRGWPSLPCRANVAKNFQSPKSKKKKSSHKVTLVRKLSSRATFLSHRQDKVRAGPYPGFFLSKKLHM